MWTVKTSLFIPQCIPDCSHLTLFELLFFEPTSSRVLNRSQCGGQNPAHSGAGSPLNPPDPLAALGVGSLFAFG